MTMRSDWIWAQYKRLPPFTWLGKLDWEYTNMEDAMQADNGSGDASRITPDPAGDDVTADDGRPVDVLRTAHTYRAVMARLYGTYSAKAQRAAAVFESLFAVRNVKFA